MKILAIRGKNIASLAEEFEINFEDSPLAETGLFAITGNTGAGKSTLFDIICLALFDKTPRLKDQKKEKLVDDGENALTTTDTRNLLRRGTVEGFAEIDFLGVDKKTYRSRWAVRRSHNKILGSLQAVSMSFLCLQSQKNLGNTKTEILAEIALKIGLNFDQFTRSVLLAQNDFSAFLKADEGERSELLETLTGTEIYSELSIKAHRKASEENLRLAEINAQLKGLHLLSDAELQILRAEKNELRLKCETADTQKTALLKEQKWHEECEKLDTFEKDSKDLLHKIEHEMNLKLEDFEKLNKIEKIQSAREFNNAVLETSALKIALENQFTAVLKQLSEAEKGENEVNQKYLLAENRLVEEELQFKKQSQLFAKVREQDFKIASAQKYFSELDRQCKVILKKENDLKSGLDFKVTANKAEDEKSQIILKWMSENNEFRNVFLNWSKIESAIVRGNALHIKRNLLRTEFKPADKLLHSAEEQNALFTKQCSNLAIELHNLELNLKSCQQRFAPEAEQAALVERINVENLLHDGLGKLEFVRKFYEIRVQKDHLTEKIGKVQARILELDFKIQNLESEIPVAKIRLETTSHLLHLAQIAASQNVSELRNQLISNEPCPVCGSQSHPFVEDNADTDVSLKILNEEHTRILQTYSLLSDEKQRYESQCKEFTSDLKIDIDDLANLEVKFLEQQFKWNALLSELKFNRDSDNENKPAADIAKAIEFLISENQKNEFFKIQIDEKLIDLSAWRKEFNEVENKLSLMQRAKFELELKRESSLHAVNEAKRNKESIVQQGSNYSQEIETCLATVNQFVVNNSPVNDSPSNDSLLNSTLINSTGEPVSVQKVLFSDAQNWTKKWSESPDQFLEAWQSQVDLWIIHTENLKQCRLNCEVLGFETKELEKQLQVILADRTDAEKNAFGAQAELNFLIELRREWFQDKIVNEAQLKQEQELNVLKSNIAHIKKEQEELRDIKVRTESQSAQLKARLQESCAQFDIAQLKLDQWLNSFIQDNIGTNLDKLDLNLLRELLLADAAWINFTREQKRRLELTFAEYKATWSLNLERLQEHLKLYPEPQNAAQIAQLILEIRVTLDSLQNRLAQVNGSLSHHENQGKNLEELTKKLTEQEKNANLWQQLNDLMGSANGKKFRSFAQQLTLEHLVIHANYHLKSLARRYEIAKVKGSSLALQMIDLDMGNETRSVHSLSGGESFLVSLSLALGLASLSSERVRVESLFIDEGFGSLDPETLQVAMDALENLQSSGRKVGVISHVPEMTERIGTRIVVSKYSEGQSRVRVVS